MESPNQPDPKSTPPSPEALISIVVGGNLGALILLGLVGGVGAMLALPVLNIAAGLVLLLLKKKRLGLALLMSGLLVGLIGLGTCALLLANIKGGH